MVIDRERDHAGLSQPRTAFSIHVDPLALASFCSGALFLTSPSVTLFALHQPPPESRLFLPSSFFHVFVFLACFFALLPFPSPSVFTSVPPSHSLTLFSLNVNGQWVP
ncbi:hypothetical protein BC826DRAFT_1043689 [Russula brevipes]|nr:hypothetical protein BC826DRAFT_1043689 [Russula brevipes]